MAGRLLLYTARALMDHKHERDDDGNEGQPVPLAFVIGAVIVLVVTPVTTLFVIWKYCWRPSRLQAAALRAQATIDGANDSASTGLGKDELDAIPTTVYSKQERARRSSSSQEGEEGKEGEKWKEVEKGGEDDLEDAVVARHGCLPSCFFLQLTHSEPSATVQVPVESPEAVVIDMAEGHLSQCAAEAGSRTNGTSHGFGEIQAVGRPLTSPLDDKCRLPDVQQGNELLDGASGLPIVETVEEDVGGKNEHRCDVDRLRSDQEQGGSSTSGMQLSERLSEISREAVEGAGGRIDEPAGRVDRRMQEIPNGRIDEANQGEVGGNSEEDGRRLMGRMVGSPVPSGRSVLIKSDTADTESQSVDATCAVCLGEFETGELVKTLPLCNHTFHAMCIDAWLGKRASCPYCRELVRVVRPATSTDAGYDGGSTSTAPNMTTGRVVAAGSPASGQQRRLPRTATAPTWLANQVFGSREGLPYSPAMDRSEELLPYSAGLLLSFITRPDREQPPPQRGHPSAGEARQGEMHFPEPRGRLRSGRRLSGSASSGPSLFRAPAPTSGAVLPVWRRSFGLPSGRGSGT